MKNISQDIIEVLQFYRCLVLQLAFNGVDDKKKGDADYTRETINLFADDLLKLAVLANKVYADILNQKPAPVNAEKTIWDGSIMTDNDEISF